MKNKLSFPMYATVYTPGGAILKNWRNCRRQYVS